MTEKARFSITLDDDLFDRVDEYQHKNRISTRSQAIVKLIEIGYDVLIEETDPKAENANLIEYARRLLDDEKEVIEGYRVASEPVRKIMLSAARDALKKNHADRLSDLGSEETA